ncbi:hypothetical protein CXB51_013630 [Gossypium anomalum]|uniref:GINS subunit domain-containing protein n=1 Tax=Gossypium anomalum TaxID=47600 RepID=A0A8J6D0I0_9ROSI|nr:hypothetical protein CXB51_013630 [Gossypium anomalum]
MANYFNIDDILAEEEFVPVVFHKAANGVIIDPSSETNSVEQGAKVELPLWLAQDLYLRQAISISVPACFNQRTILGDERITDLNDWLLDTHKPFNALSSEGVLTRLEIQADAACVDLKSRSPYFYEFGCKIAPLGSLKVTSSRIEESKQCRIHALSLSLGCLASRPSKSNWSNKIVSNWVGDKTIEILLLSAFKIRYKEILTKAYTAAYTTASKFLTLLTKEESNLYEAAQVSMSAFKKWRMGGPRLQRASVLGRKRRSFE